MLDKKILLFSLTLLLACDTSQPEIRKSSEPTLDSLVQREIRQTERVRPAWPSGGEGSQFGDKGAPVLVSVFISLPIEKSLADSLLKILRGPLDSPQVFNVSTLWYPSALSQYDILGSATAQCLTRLGKSLEEVLVNVSGANYAKNCAGPTRADSAVVKANIEQAKTAGVRDVVEIFAKSPRGVMRVSSKSIGEDAATLALQLDGMARRP